MDLSITEEKKKKALRVSSFFTMPNLSHLLDAIKKSRNRFLVQLLLLINQALPDFSFS